METRSGILGRVAENTLSWVGLGLIVLVGVAIYQTPAATKQVIWSTIWRSGFWIVLVAAIPWTGKLFIKRVLDYGSNWSGVALVAGFTLADVIVGWILMTGSPASGWGWFAILGALGVAGTYNYLVGEYLADMAGG